jgi:hypothetical protein
MNLSGQQDAPSVLGIRTQPEAERCAHIVISPTPNIDPRMVKDIPKTFSSNMPRLQVLQPCCREYPATNNLERTESSGASK